MSSAFEHDTDDGPCACGAWHKPGELRAGDPIPMVAGPECEPGALAMQARLRVAADVLKECRSAQEAFPPFNSAHEGYSVLNEERHELWIEVMKKQGARDLAKLRKEAIQVAAMAIRFVIDVCDEGRGQR